MLGVGELFQAHGSKLPLAFLQIGYYIYNKEITQ